MVNRSALRILTFAATILLSAILIQAALDIFRRNLSPLIVIALLVVALQVFLWRRRNPPGEW